MFNRRDEARKVMAFVELRIAVIQVLLFLYSLHVRKLWGREANVICPLFSLTYKYAGYIQDTKSDSK
jgi:hypothetical protein